MKISKTLLAGLMVVGSAAAASAQTHLYFAGSTAYRAPVTRAIQDVLGAYTVAYDPGSPATKTLYSTGNAIISGTLQYGASAGQWVIIKTDWTGSAAGLTDLAAGTVDTFMADSNLTGLTPGTSGTNAVHSFTTDPETPNVTMSDSFLSSVVKSIASATTGGTTFSKDINNANIDGAGTEAEGNNGVVGIIPFEWLAGAQTSGSCPITNMTQEGAAAMETNGYVSVSQLGLSGTTDYAFLIGRNEDSGTRIAAQAEAQLGSASSSASFGKPMVQYYAQFKTVTAASVSNDKTFTNGVTVSGSSTIETGGTGTTVIDIMPWPANQEVNTETALSWSADGHSGQVSGGDVAAVLEATSSNTLPLTLGVSNGGVSGKPGNWVTGTSKAYLVGYIGLADAAGIPTSSTTVALTYNGVPYSSANILNGSYTFWAFEHMYYNDAISGTVAGNAADTIADTLLDGIGGTVTNPTTGTGTTNGDAQTNNNGVTDPNSPPTITPHVAGILNNSKALFTRNAEGYPLGFH
jgi:hypothetical protein